MSMKFAFSTISPCIGTAAADYLLSARKTWLRQNEDMKDLQKHFGAIGDRETAKFFKEEAAHAMKFYRAACLLIPHVASEYPGDCVLRDAYEFPPELVPFLVHLENVAGL